MELKNQNREGTISKPRAKRGTLPDLNTRTPSIDKDKIQKVGLKLSQSPSVVNIQGAAHLINDDVNEDDQQPMKPVMSEDNSPERPDEMPMLSAKHRQIANKKGSVDVVKQQRLLNENES